MEKNKSTNNQKTGLRKGLTSYGDEEFSLFLRKAFIKGAGYTDDVLALPIVGIINTWSDLNQCHAHFKQRVEDVKRGVFQAGGFPVELPAISLSETNVKPTTMLYRNFLAM